VNPSRTDGGMNILPVFCNIKTGEMFISPWILLQKIGFWQGVCSINKKDMNLILDGK
jgi:hypothetical protein